jgi:hypothetical protein
VPIRNTCGSAGTPAAVAVSGKSAPAAIPLAIATRNEPQHQNLRIGDNVALELCS